MSTRSNIAVRYTDGDRKGIYCHFDGYIEGVGVTLQLAYNTLDKIEELLELGNLSALGYYPETCRAYHRDRGEALEFWDSPQEYNYLFDEYDGAWYVEYDTWVDDTPATKALNIHGHLGKEKKLLLDAIYEIDFEKVNWIDDEFAKNGEVVDKCIEKAQEARFKALNDRRRNLLMY